MKVKAVTFGLLGLVCLAGCQSTSDNSSTAMPAPGLARTGNATGAGLSGVLAGTTSHGMPAADRPFEASAEQRAFVAPLNQQVSWTNPQTGNSGTITVTRDGYIASGAYCREFRQSYVISGQPQQLYNKACQQPDGSWRVAQ